MTFDMTSSRDCATQTTKTTKKRSFEATTKAHIAPNFIDMLAYKRPDGSRYQKKFCRRFLEPVFGKPDAHGNYTLVVGVKPRVAFMSHHDTVHHTDGRQIVQIMDDHVFSSGNDCLGADCTTGIYIMLRMIEENVPGVYVVHAGEEIGCVGSSALVKDFPAWIGQVDAAISFDRKGYTSIITHQMGSRTCSDAFADSLADILDLSMVKDSTGAYTDSNEYIDYISECTNISVGYFNQHTKKESQDLVFLEYLIQALVVADWTKLVFKRAIGAVEYNTYDKGPYKAVRKVSTYDYYDDPWNDSYLLEADVSATLYDEPDCGDIKSVMKRYPDQVAQILQSYGYSADGLLDDCIDLKEKWQRNFRH